MRIGEVFVRWKNKFVAYSRYCAQLPASRALIERYENDNKEIKQKIADCGYEANHNQFRLQDLLSVPMQRVLK
uniref:DH domain-containing protein n=1 Tax=Plectus sambesii TaxID=2011161 RepID=A0A914VIK6_9BILA